MTPGDDPGPQEPPWQGGRAWQHPSEVGLANRGRADRKRSTLIASGVLLGGVGLLLSGVVMGSAPQRAAATSSTLPLERAELSVAHVMPDGDTSHAVTGVVLDDEGHVVVEAEAVEGVDRVWVRCSDGEGGTAVVTARDRGNDVAVLRMERPAGVPASVSASTPTPGTALQVVQAGRPPTEGTELSVTDTVRRWSPIAQAISLTPAQPAERYVADVDDPAGGPPTVGQMVFDRSGRLAGMVSASPSDDGAVQVLAAADLVGAARALLDGAGD
jgi:S1-C subfamily serine protease